MNSFYVADLDVEALMYVYESASFEYENGNTEFAVFLEADDGTTGDQWHHRMKDGLLNRNERR